MILLTIIALLVILTGYYLGGFPIQNQTIEVAGNVAISNIGQIAPSNNVQINELHNSTLFLPLNISKLVGNIS